MSQHSRSLTLNSNREFTVANKRHRPPHIQQQQKTTRTTRARSQTLLKTQKKQYSVTAIAFKDDRTFAYGDDAGALFIADLSVQAPPSVFDTRRPGINELAYSKDGLLAVAAGPGTAGEVFLFD